MCKIKRPLQTTAIVLLIMLEHVSKTVPQGIPISPCPKTFQYRFDGAQWFGVLSVRNPGFGETLHLRVILSLRGKPMTNYLGEIELLTRGQFVKDAPVLYKVKFPQFSFPPKILQITTNNKVICLGPTDQSIFVTQIQLEHTRKFTFLTDNTPMPMLPATSSLPSSSSSSSSMSEISSLPIRTGFGVKFLPPANPDRTPIPSSSDVCGTIDSRIRFQVLHALQHNPTRQKGSREGLESTMPTLLPKNNAGVRNVSTSDEIDHNYTPPVVTSDEAPFVDVDEADLEELPSITRGAWPWLAAVYVNNLTSLAYQCGGTLVSTRVVISAAHCFHMFKQRYTANEVLVFLGRHNLKNWNEEGSLAAPVDDIFLHPDHNQHLNSYDADIAVVILKYEVRFNTFIRPACLWSGSTELQYIEGEHGIVVGWSLGSFNATKHPSSVATVPKVISTPIVSNDNCFKVSPQYESLSSNRTFCAGVVSQQTKSQLQRGPCTGDSGAGLMILKNDRWMLRGIVSGSLPITVSPNSSEQITRNHSSCSLNQYVLYTDTAMFLDWIFAFLI